MTGEMSQGTEEGRRSLLGRAAMRLAGARVGISLIVTAVGAAAAATAGNAEPEAYAVARIIERAYASSHANDRGWSLEIDNDLFALTQSDRDYTGGLGVTVHGPQTPEYRWSPDPLLARLDRLTVPGAENVAAVLHAVQVALIGFTPEDLRTTAVVPEDRPYAGLLFVTAARQYVTRDQRTIRYSELSVGALGLSLTSDLHDAVHDVVDSESPRGYDHQISAGGELTARYVTGGARLRGQRLVLGSRLLESKSNWELSAGYLTEASYAFSTRLGAIRSPWWSFNPERVDYIARPSPLAGTRSGANELYVWAGAKLRLRAYNAFLQGQFRDSDHTFSHGELNQVIGEVWLGVTGQISSDTQVSYVMRYQTAEIRDGIGSRDPLWAGVTISHGF
jgi:hypothetical protein